MLLSHFEMKIYASLDENIGSEQKINLRYIL